MKWKTTESAVKVKRIGTVGYYAAFCAEGSEVDARV